MTRLLAIALCFLVAPVFAQTGAGYHIQQFTTENGLPSNGIKGIEWDEQTGFLWIATEAGISRFNGTEFNNFTKENTPALVRERMAYMVRDDKGTIHVADGISRFFSITNNQVVPESFSEARNAGFKMRLFLGTTNPVLKKNVLAVLDLLGDAAFYRLLRTTDSTISIINPARKTAYTISDRQPGYRPLPIPVIFVDEFMIDGNLFARDAQHRLYLVKKDFSSYQPVPLQYSGGGPVADPANNLVVWDVSISNPILFSGPNAWELHYRDAVVQAELICTAVPSASFIRFARYSDKNKTLFIGTDSKGLIVINKDRVVPMKYTDIDIGERNAYYSQVEMLNDYVLTNESHVIGPGDKYHGPLPIKGKFDFSVYTTGDSLLWYVQFEPTVRTNVLHCYNYKTGNTTVYGKIVVQSNFALTPGDGRFYIATYRGLGYLEGDSIHFLFTPPANKTFSPPYAVLDFGPGILGVASCDGLILYDIKKIKTDTLLGKTGNCYRNLWKYKDYIFIGSYGDGFYMWKDGKLKHMPLDKNKFLLYAHCFVPDGNGYCWISTNRGLFKASLSDLVDAFENNKELVYYHYYGKNDGMSMTEMNGGCSPCALVLKNKSLSFPTMDGLLWINPDEAKPLLPEGNIYIDEFVAGDTRFTPDSIDGRSLPSSYRNILIKLGYSSWCNKENIYLEYQLNNNKKWIAIDVNNGAFIRLNGLSPGEYKLRIRKLNGFGIDNYSYKELHFTIRTPWTRTWGFYALCGLVLFGGIALYLRWRTRQYKIRQRKLERQVAEKTKELQEQNEILEKNNTIKTRLISIISHDIVTPLKFVTVAGKNLIEKKEQMPEDLQRETLQEITNTSQELQLLSTNILNWIKYQNENRRMVKESFDLHEMVRQVFGILQSLAKQKELVIKNEVPADLRVHQYYEPVKILVYNLMTNAIQFTEKGSITVSAVKDNGFVTVAVKDEGIGMTTDQIQRLMAEEVVITSANVDNKRGHGLGFLIIKDLVKTMEATLSIESKKEEGTTISVKMPATKNEVS